MGKGDRREGGGGRRPEEGGTQLMGEARGGAENPAAPGAPRGGAPSRRAPGWPPCPGRRGDPGRDLGPDAAGGDPWSSCGHPPAPPRRGPAPSARGPGLPFPPPHPAGPPRGAAGAAAEITVPSLPGGSAAQPLWDAAFWGGRGPPQHLKCLKRVCSVLTVSEIKKKQ